MSTGHSRTAKRAGGGESGSAGRPGRQPPLGRGAKIAIGAALLVVALGVGLTVTAVWPTSVTAVSEEVPARVWRRGLPVAPGSCGLTEQRGAPGCEPARPRTVRDEEVAFPSRLTHRGLAELRGTLSVPVGLDGPRPGVVLIHGSGPNDRDSPSRGDLVHKLAKPFPVLAALAEVLAQRGLVVLRYDKRSCRQCYPEASFDPAGFSFEHFEADARDALAYLRRRPEVLSDALVVMGHSQGGQYAPFVAADDPSVVAVVMLAGTTQTFEEGLIGQLERLESIRWRQLDPLGALQVAGQRRKLQRCFDELRGDYDPDDQCIGGGVTQRALAEYLEYGARTVGRIQQLRCPLLAVFGSVDRNIDPAVAAEVKQALRGKAGEVHVIAGMAHSLTDALAPADPPALHPELVEVLGEFLRSVKRPAPERAP